MKKLKFRVGDIVTVADPKDPSHLVRFQEVIGILPTPKGTIPYSLKSVQLGRILGPVELNLAIPDMMEADLRGEYKFRSIPMDSSSNLGYFESMYRIVSEKEKMIYLNGRKKV